MRYQYNLSEQDFLIHTLYSVSKNPSLKKQTKRVKLFFTILFVIFLFVIYSQNDLFTFIIAALTFLFLYSFYVFYLYKYFLKNNYEKWNKQNLGIRFNKEAVLDFKDDFIETSGMDIKLEIKYDAIEEFNEIPDYYYFKLKTNERLIIPKREIHNKESFLEMVENIQTHYNFTITKELDWKW